MNNKRTTLRMLATALLVLLVVEAQAAETKHDPRDVVVAGAPSFRDVLSLDAVGSVRISPDGEQIAYSVRTVDWKENRWDSEVWLWRDGAEPFQLTRTSEGDSSSPRWSPDGRWLAFLANRGSTDDAKPQVYRLDPRGGEALQITAAEEGVLAFAWSPDSQNIAYTSRDKIELEAREKQYGRFAVEDSDLSYAHLWLQPAEVDAEAHQLTSGDEFTVGGFRFAPDSASIAFDHQPTSQVDDFVRSSLSIVAIEGKQRRLLVDEPGGVGLGHFSPDGSWLSFVGTFGANPYFGNRSLGRVRLSTGEIENLTADWDESVSPVSWTDGGIGLLSGARTRRLLYRLDPEVRSMVLVPLGSSIVRSASVARDGSVAFVGEGADHLPEIFYWQVDAAERVTDMTDQVAGWPLGTREVIEWRSKDGAMIEGVLMKPDGFDSSVRRPLLVVIHGGPTGTSRPTLLSSYVYPITQWLARGALILMPNYRGSAGYGAGFRAKNVRNLGVGDQWDVESGVDHLIDTGLADPERVGAMGWSQGGYISAFLAANSSKFRAISDGAGISDWMTYYVNTDIHGFTRNYLEATPWDDPEIYAKTSPIHYIKNAQTPTLIQHGENDARVPLPNAYQLYQALQDQGVPTRLVVYKGFGHGITKPKERLAALWHNWQWFEQHLFGNEVEIPIAETDPEGDG